MSAWLVLPVKSIADGKSRLAPHLSAATRRELNVELLSRSLALAACYPGIDRTVVVSRCADVLAIARAHGVQCVVEEGGFGLNEAVEQAVARVRGHAQEILVMACDLPLVRDDDLRAIVQRSQVSNGCVVLATDRAGSGTNALCLPPGASFRFCYGRSSRQRHVEEAERQALPCCVLQRMSLAFDIDTFDDYREWQGLTAPSRESGGQDANGASLFARRAGA